MKEFSTRYGFQSAEEVMTDKISNTEGSHRIRPAGVHLPNGKVTGRHCSQTELL
jgi:hypothetical protein